MTQRCKKCRSEKGKPHKSACVAARYPSSYPESTLYIQVSDSGWSWGGGCSSPSDTGSSSDSGSSGGDCG